MYLQRQLGHLTFKTICNFESDVISVMFRELMRQCRNTTSPKEVTTALCVYRKHRERIPVRTSY